MALKKSELLEVMLTPIFGLVNLYYLNKNGIKIPPSLVGHPLKPDIHMEDIYLESAGPFLGQPIKEDLRKIVFEVLDDLYNLNYRVDPSKKEKPRKGDKKIPRLEVLLKSPETVVSFVPQDEEEVLAFKKRFDFAMSLNSTYFMGFKQMVLKHFEVDTSNGDYIEYFIDSYEKYKEVVLNVINDFERRAQNKHVREDYDTICKMLQRPLEHNDPLNLLMYIANKKSSHNHPIDIVIFKIKYDESIYRKISRRLTNLLRGYAEIKKIIKQRGNKDKTYDFVIYDGEKNNYREVTYDDIFITDVFGMMIGFNGKINDESFLFTKGYENIRKVKLHTKGAKGFERTIMKKFHTDSSFQLDVQYAPTLADILLAEFIEVAQKGDNYENRKRKNDDNNSKKKGRAHVYYQKILHERYSRDADYGTIYNLFINQIAMVMNGCNFPPLKHESLRYSSLVDSKEKLKLLLARTKHIFREFEINDDDEELLRGSFKGTSSVKCPQKITAKILKKYMCTERTTSKNLTEEITNLLSDYHHLLMKIIRDTHFSEFIIFQTYPRTDGESNLNDYFVEAVSEAKKLMPLHCLFEKDTVIRIKERNSKIKGEIADLIHLSTELSDRCNEIYVIWITHSYGENRDYKTNYFLSIFDAFNNHLFSKDKKCYSLQQIDQINKNRKLCGGLKEKLVFARLTCFAMYADILIKFYKRYNSGLVLATEEELNKIKKRSNRLYMAVEEYKNLYKKIEQFDEIVKHLSPYVDSTVYVDSTDRR